MEEEPSDPHEQQLYYVFKSCLTEGQNGLDKDGLLALCSKLELEESHRTAIVELLEIDTVNRSVSFYEFRDSFLALLGKSQEGLEKEVHGDSQALCKTFDHQRLQETWSNQNSLSIEDINGFCNGGSTLSKQSIELIFEKLDLDNDGFINRDEFLHFVQSASSKFHEQSRINWSTHPRRDQIKPDKDFVHHQTGHVLRSAIIELWEVAGIPEANSLLHELGFDAPTINLIDLSNALSSELKCHRDVSHAEGAGEYVRLLKGALALYQEEVRNLHTSMEHLCCERNKLRADIGEANDRANVLAQEIDEHQTRVDKARQEQIRQMEARHQEALKDITDQLNLERDKSSLTIKSLEEQLQASQQAEQRITAELSRVLQELKLLETENQNQSEEIGKLEISNSQLTKQVQELAAAHEQAESIETRENEQVSDLMSHIKRLQAEMKVLRDHNDELTSELEVLKHRDNDVKSIVSSIEIRSTISDENDGLISMPTTEISDTEDEDKHHQKYSDHSRTIKVINVTRSKPSVDEQSSNGNSINKLTEIIQEFRNFLTGAKFCVECAVIRTEVSSLISELELYQSSVPANQATLATNNKKKQLRNLANELEAECKSSSRINESSSCRDLVMPRNDRFKNCRRISSSDDMIHDMDENFDVITIKAAPKNKLSGLRDYPPRKESEKTGKKGVINNLYFKKCNVEVKDPLKEEEARHAAEKKQLQERVSDLEKSLEMLKAEYEQCEDYWCTKLEEERQIFEQEQKISDEKFSELIVKMAEYEEQFNPSGKHDGRLSPIEERFSLEQQYNDLEDEFEQWRNEAQEELSKKTKEIEELKAKLSSEKRLSLADISVQFPEEPMKDMYPTLYNQLCSPGGSTENTTPKTSSTVPMEANSCTMQQCVQCHKLTTQPSCDCHANTHQNLPQQHYEGQKSRRSEGKSRHHHHHYHKKMEVDYEFTNLIKQKEKLKQEIMKLQNLKTMNANHIYPMIAPEHQTIFSNLCAKLYAQEQKQKYMQVYYQTQQKNSEQYLQEIYKQHLLDMSNLQFVIKATEDKLNRQIKLNQEQKDKLTKNDFLTKELYVENAQLTETIKRLEQHCQILTQNRIETTST
ncbi:hypothetical protein TSAR_014405 [Trichomalopsis sarcophagae]|uniref:EF-hand domain-containing protein n=1 Tax=Trichomalopsis sarcophagae TaxID=543379 RepID=A0A232F4G3_9HYME|nr:hypothetical protein TSAR_014405 [Trichomalopsis sarcophagae]